MSQEAWQQINPEIRRKILPPGKQMMSMLIEFKQGGFGPEHAHPHEQLGFVIQGKIKMLLDGKEIVAEAGDQVCVPGNIPHSVLALEDSLVLETFTPLREDLLSTMPAIIETEMKS
ncbi:cupin domain-containing protein [Cohnella silvisoli]|uniref:Cupin domain-containing protein n=1 Tax=Cohnella silvisoli TaxID=2873699 RepID=A0ABV1KWX4_9BACL|nr:cupin domain-containing protein [Cohnella silvisoli]MCD9023791.1 cupin domain-containing protein [Cohnella silvisoli]